MVAVFDAEVEGTKSVLRRQESHSAAVDVVRCGRGWHEIRRWISR